MGIVKKKSKKDNRCKHPEHNPPGMLVIPHGHDWRCPACGQITETLEITC